MSKLEEIIRERREKALAVADQIEWQVEPVECDDYGDPYFKWHITYWLGTDYIWDDWWHDKPDDTKVYNAMLEGIKEGSLGDTIADHLGQEENYNKMLDERRRICIELKTSGGTSTRQQRNAPRRNCGL